MNLEKYTDALKRLPMDGKHIIGYQTENSIIFYQAYKESIAFSSVRNQVLGGADFSYDRMSWIKPGFLWMMHRSGWATKESQERILAIEIDKNDFILILKQAVHSSYKPKLYKSNNEWSASLKNSDVVIQWDPDHDPFGRKIDRRAIQIGLRGDTLEKFGKHYVKRISDITSFIKEQQFILRTKGEDDLMIPIETIFKIDDELLRKQIGL